MKFFYAVIAFSLFISSCSMESEDAGRPFENREMVFGKWNYIERTFSIGTSKQIKNKIENDEITLEFLPNEKLVSAGFFECDQATYQIEGDILRIEFACDAEQAEWEYKLSWERENLVLKPVSPSTCIEGCSQIFRRISPIRAG